MSIHDNSSEYTIVWQSEEQLRHRIAQDALPNYIPVVRRVVIEFFQEYQHSHELEAHVAFALTPDFVPLFEVQVQPECEPSRVAQLLKRLETLEAPPVWSGPVAASTIIKIGTGCDWTAAHIEFPFSKTMAFLSAEEPIDDFLMRYATAEKSRQRTTGVLLKKWLVERSQTSFLRKWSHKLPRDWQPELVRVVSAGLLPPLPVEPPEELDIPDLAPMPLDQINELIRTFPDDARHYWRRIRIWLQNEDHERVTNDCREVLRLLPEHIWTQFVLIQALRLIGDSAGALLLLNELIQKHPRLLQASVERSEIYVELGAFDAACQDIDHAVELSPRWPALRRWRARLRAYLDRVDQALEDLAVAQRLDPYDAETYGWRALIRRQSDTEYSADSPSTRSSLTDIEMALLLNPKSEMALISRADIRIAAEQFEAAIDDCNHVLEHRPDSGDALAFRGLAQFRRSHFQDAVADLTMALQKRCFFGFARTMLADAQYQVGDREAALTTIEELLARSHDHVPTLFRKEALLQELDRPQEAIDVLDMIIDLDPTLSEAFGERGNAHRAINNWHRALDDYATAMRLGDFSPAVKLNHALTLLDLQRFEDALVEFNEGIREMPDSGLAYFQRGRVHLALQQHDKAIADFTEALNRNPEWAEAYFLRGNLHMSRRDFVAAVRDFDELVSRDPSSRCYVARAHAKIMAGQLESADVDIQEAISLEPGNAEEFRLLQHMLETQFHLGREEFSAAVESASAALELDEHCIPALRLRAASHWYGNELVEAIDDYSAVIEQSGPNSECLSGRGQVYAELGEYELALKDLTEAIEMADTDIPEEIAYPQSGRGIALTGLQRYDEAAAAFEESIRLCPGNAWVHYHHGLMYDAFGQTKAALLCFQLSLRLTTPPLRPRQRSRVLAFLNREEQSQSSQSNAVANCR